MDDKSPERAAEVDRLLQIALYDTRGETVEGAFVDGWESNAGNATDALEEIFEHDGYTPQDEERIRRALSVPDVPADAAENLLSALGELTQPLTESMLTDAAPHVRRIALRTLGNFLAGKYRSAYPVDCTLILRALGDETGDVRETAIQMLSQPNALTKAADQEIHFVRATLDANPRVRLAAAQGLALLNTTSAGEALVAWLDREKDGRVRAEAIIAVAETVKRAGGATTGADLAKKVGEPIVTLLSREINHSEPKVRAAVAGALERLKAAEVMIERLAIETDRDVQAALLPYPGPGYSFIPDRSLPVLTSLLTSTSDQAIKGHIVWQLGQFGQQAVPYLLSILEDPNSIHHRGAVIGLGRIGDPAALPAIERELERTARGFYYSEIESAIRSLKCRLEYKARQ